MKYDTIIIGQGPAGISCAIYLKRFNFNPLVIAKDYGALAIAHKIDNYYGVESVNGKDLILKGINQAKDLGIEIKNEEVLSIDNLDGLKVITNEGSYEANSIFLAMGKARSTLNVKGLKEFEGKGISYCAICDGFFYRKKSIAIIGSSLYMQSELEVLKRFTDDITIFTNGADLNLPSMKIVKDKILEFKGLDHLEEIVTENGNYKVSGAFIAVGSANALSFASHLGLQIDDSNYLVTKNFKTNLPGIFAGGDIIGGLLQVSKAVSDGANASIEIKKYLQDLK